jgi:hypothetical protein
MRPLNSSELLDLWQDGSTLLPVARSLQLIGSACDAPSIADMARLSIGERDLRLLQLREWLFGTRLRNIVNCPVCMALSEWEGDTATLRLQQPRPDDADRRYAYETEGYRLAYRLPNSEDLYQAKDEAAVLTACILSVESDQGHCPPAECPGSVLEKLAEQIERQDPQADIRFTVHCPACAHSWETVFDIGTYLWAEIDNWARRTLEEIYTLAFYFGWSEEAILSMSPKRRSLYIQLIRS